MTTPQQSLPVARVAFDLLPTEVIIAILGELDAQTLVRCKQVCQLLATVIEGSVELKYKIELFGANMDDGPPSSVTTADRLKLLQAHQTAWKNLAWTKQSVVPVPYNSDMDSWKLSGGVLGMASGCCLLFIQVPSVFRGIKEKVWTVENIGFEVEDFIMDPSLDLLVALELVQMTDEDIDCQLHLCSLSDGTPHPLASREIVSYQCFGAYWIKDYILSVFFNHLVVLHMPNKLIIWNWITGKMEKILYGGFKTFTFLTSHLVIVGVLSEGSGCCFARLDVIDINNLPKLRTDISDAKPVCSFRLPTLGISSAMTSTLLILLQHPPSWAPNSIPEYPFSTSHDDQILAIILDHFTVFVHLSAILARIHSTHDGETSCVFPWKDWGPRNTRMVSRVSYGNVYIQGMKFAISLPNGSGFQLCDLNYRSIKRWLFSGEVDTQAECLTKATTFTCDVEGNRFEPVTTSLPCLIRTCMSPDLRDGDEIVLTEDGLIVMPWIVPDLNFAIFSF